MLRSKQEARAFAIGTNRSDLEDRTFLRFEKMLDRVSTRGSLPNGLKQRAAELGEIEEISEDPDTGSLTIRVKV